MQLQLPCPLHDNPPEPAASSSPSSPSSCSLSSSSSIVCPRSVHEDPGLLTAWGCATSTKCNDATDAAHVHACEHGDVHAGAHALDSHGSTPSASDARNTSNASRIGAGGNLSSAPLPTSSQPRHQPTPAPSAYLGPSRKARTSRFANACDLADMLLMLPIELHQRILQLAGPLAQHIHGVLPNPLSSHMFSLILAECFKFDCTTLVQTNATHRKLPLNFSLTWEPLFIHSSQMSRIATEQFPSLSSSQTGISMLVSQNASALVPLRDTLIYNLHLNPHTAATLKPIAHELLHWICLNISPPFDPAFAEVLIDCASGLGRYDLLVALLRATAPTIPTVTPTIQVSWRAHDLATLNNHTRIVRFLCETQHNVHVRLDGAVRTGNLALAQYIRERFPSIFPFIGSVDALLSRPNDQISLEAKRNMTEWLITTSQRGTPSALDRSTSFLQQEAARHGHLELLRDWVQRGIGTKGSRYLMDDAAEGGHLTVLQWLHDNNIGRCSPNASRMASSNGHIHILKWMLVHRREALTPTSMVNAAVNGHVEVFLWLLQLYGDRLPSIADMLDACALGHFWIIEAYLKKWKQIGDQSVASGNGNSNSNSSSNSNGDDQLLPFVQVALENGHLEIAKIVVSNASVVLHSTLMNPQSRKRFTACAQWLDLQIEQQTLLALHHQRKWYRPLQYITKTFNIFDRCRG